MNGIARQLVPSFCSKFLSTAFSSYLFVARHLISVQTPKYERTPGVELIIKDLRKYAFKNKHKKIVERTYEALKAASIDEANDICSVASTVLARKARHTDITSLIHYMKEKNIPLSNSIYSAAISALNKSRQHKAALQFFMEMRESYFEPFSATMCIAVEAAVRVGYWYEAKALIREMREQQHIGPPGVLYDKALNACENMGPKEDVYEWLDTLIVNEKKARGVSHGRAPIRK